ncbi:hypothetical protein GN956_G2509 [Arapaima gigas]
MNSVTFAQEVESDVEDQDEFFSFLTHIQGGRMDEQRCVFDPNKKNPSTTSPSGLIKCCLYFPDSDMDQLLNLVASTQSCRLDDQRVSMSTSLAGLHVVSHNHLDGLEEKDTVRRASQVSSLVRTCAGLLCYN